MKVIVILSAAYSSTVWYHCIATVIALSTIRQGHHSPETIQQLAVTLTGTSKKLSY